MVRKKLAKVDGKRLRFRGEFVRFGYKSGYNGYPVKTLLFKNVFHVNDERINTDHLWFTITKQFEKLNLQEGDIVEFDARVKEYEKGYKGYREELMWEKPVEIDYKLSYPTKVELIQRVLIIEDGNPKT